MALRKKRQANFHALPSSNIAAYPSMDKVVGSPMARVKPRAILVCLMLDESSPSCSDLRDPGPSP
jgi:hypothetical protein